MIIEIKYKCIIENIIKEVDLYNAHINTMVVRINGNLYTYTDDGELLNKNNFNNSCKDIYNVLQKIDSELKKNEIDILFCYVEICGCRSFIYLPENALQYQKEVGEELEKFNL